MPNSWRVKAFLKSVAERLNIGPDQTRAGLIAYGTYACVMSSLGETATLEDLKQEFDSIPFGSGQQRVDRALKLAAGELLSGNGRTRKGVPKVLMLLTYEEQVRAANSVGYSEAARSLKEDGVNVFVVKIGRPDKGNQLENENSTTFAVHGFYQLPKVVGSLSNSLFESASKIVESDSDVE